MPAMRLVVFVCSSLLLLVRHGHGYSAPPRADAVQFGSYKDSPYSRTSDFDSGYGGGAASALVDAGPSDVIHDLHAKYQAAVNKAESVAQAALHVAGDALKEQAKEKKSASSFSTRYKRDIAKVRGHRHHHRHREEERLDDEDDDDDQSDEFEEEEENARDDEDDEEGDLPRAGRVKSNSADKISPQKIDKMIDLMNSLNQQFAKMISKWDKLASNDSGDDDDDGKDSNKKSDTANKEKPKAKSGTKNRSSISGSGAGGSSSKAGSSKKETPKKSSKASSTKGDEAEKDKKRQQQETKKSHAAAAATTKGPKKTKKKHHQQQEGKKEDDEEGDEDEDEQRRRDHDDKDDDDF